MKYQVDKAIEVLTATPKTLNAWLCDLSAEWTLQPNDRDTWSAFDVLGHLIHGEQTDWIPRAKIILAQSENITFKPFDRFAQFEISKGKSLPDLLKQFDELREKNIFELRQFDLTENTLQLKGIHPELGEVTLEQLLSTWLVHDLTHIRQISIELAKKYSSNVGAWKEYLTILQ